ncbi:hypothetical protein ACHQM5_029956 [Ranunculus cassubicifolius]
MLKRKMKGVAMEVSPSQNIYEEQGRSRKFQSLMQDYNDLFKETEEKRKNIQIAKRRKRILMAEVRFLRQRYEELMEYKSREQHLVRIQAPQMHQRDALSMERSRQDREAHMSNSAPVLDLNQIANDDDEEEIQVQPLREPVRYIEPMRMEKKSVKFAINNVAGKPPLPPRQKDMKLTVCRDVRKGNNRNGKRKISLQDPVALRV